MTSNNAEGLPVLSPRDSGAHKGRFGKLLIVATSPGMTGAGVLAARAALRSGAGLVTLAVPRSQQPVVAAQLTSAMSLGLPETSSGALCARASRPLLAALDGATACAIGPGLGRDEATGSLLTAVLGQIGVPLVLDADALYHLSFELGALAQRPRPTVLTPHPGEMARLTGCTTADIQSDRVGQATRFATEHGVVLLLKGRGTLITDGQRCWRNPTGNPGMASGGSGDVLTGVIGALVAQGMGALGAARLGAYVHGLAGDLAARRVGQVSLIADDLVDDLPAAYMELEEGP